MGRTPQSINKIKQIQDKMITNEALLIKKRILRKVYTDKSKQTGGINAYLFCFAMSFVGFYGAGKIKKFNRALFNWIYCYIVSYGTFAA